MTHRDSCALTLTELLVVCAIITLLVTVLLPPTVAIQEKAKRGACCANLRQIGEAMAGYAAEYKSFFPYRGPNSGREAADYLTTYGQVCQGNSAGNYDRQCIDKPAGGGIYSQGLGLLYQRKHTDKLNIFLCPGNPFLGQCLAKLSTRTLDQSHYSYLAWEGKNGSAGQNPDNVKYRCRSTDNSGRAIVADQGIGQNTGESGPPQAGWNERQHRNEGHNVLYVSGNVRWLPIDRTYPGDPGPPYFQPQVFNMGFGNIDQTPLP